MNHDSLKEPQPTSGATFDFGMVKLSHPPGILRKTPPPMNPEGLDSNGRRLPPIQYAFPRKEKKAKAKVRESRREAVRTVFRKNWASYREFAWRTDALLPLSAGGREQFCGWAATLVDSLDTLWIMGMREEFDEAVVATAAIDFSNSTSNSVNTFETNIRYLGGLLSAYDLSGRPVLLEKARELGDLLYLAFNTPSRMPVDFIDLERAKAGTTQNIEQGVVSASPGTLSLEMTRLARATGDDKYYDAAWHISDLFYRHQNETQIPGMWPTYVSMRYLDVVKGAAFTLGGGADSLYEYLPKMYALVGDAEPMYRDMTRTFLDAAERNLFFRPMLPGGEDILISAPVHVEENDMVVLEAQTEHLTCFVGGMYALAGRLFEHAPYIETGIKLTHGCAFAYRSMPSGMMPERYETVACESRVNCPWNETLWELERGDLQDWNHNLPKGFIGSSDTRYILRPEAIESVFVAYRITGREEFRDIAWDMFQAINKGTATRYANAAVMDVTNPIYPMEQEDYMEVKYRRILGCADMHADMLVLCRVSGWLRRSNTSISSSLLQML
jgi:mannosyl-oligosaccharide alpha-1,2-mannosidase